MLAKFKQYQLKANSAQEAVDKMERMERDLKAKNLELADMLRERDRARFEIDRQKGSHKEEIDRLRRELNFANERAEDSSRSRNSEVSSVMSKFNRQISELEDSLRVRRRYIFESQYSDSRVQGKQDQIDELLRKIDGTAAEMEHLRDEKDQEILILQETVDTTLEQLAEAQQVRRDTETFAIQSDTTCAGSGLD